MHFKEVQAFSMHFKAYQSEKFRVLYSLSGQFEEDFRVINEAFEEKIRGGFTGCYVSFTVFPGYTKLRRRSCPSEDVEKATVDESDLSPCQYSSRRPPTMEIVHIATLCTPLGVQYP